MSEARGWRMVFTGQFWRAYGEVLIDLRFSPFLWWDGDRYAREDADPQEPVEKPE